MDKIWDRNPSKSEVICRWGVDEKTEWPRSNDKCRTLKFYFQYPKQNMHILWLMIYIYISLFVSCKKRRWKCNVLI